jgi:DNA-binding transcriptional MerR regulator
MELTDHLLFDSHAVQPTASSTLEVKMEPPDHLTIGALARRTGVATSALRYWEELGLLPAPVRVSGQRRYPPETLELVGLVLLLRDAGFTLRELKTLMAARPQGLDVWRAHYESKLAELDARIAKAEAARTAIAHGLACPHTDGLFACPNFNGAIAARLAGASLPDSHPA